MNLLTIPLRNARRKMLRTLFLLVVFALGVTSVVALDHVSRVVGDSLEKKLSAFGANILITPRTEALSINYGGFSMGNVTMGEQTLPMDATARSINSIHYRARLAAVAPKLLVTTGLPTSKGSTPVGVIGVDWRNELAIKNHWGVTGAFPVKDNEVLLGSDVARLLALNVGDTLPIGTMDARVSGILQPTGGDDDAVVFAGLGPLQQATGNADTLHFVEVSALCGGCPIDMIVTQLEDALPGVKVTALQQVVAQRMQSIDFVQHLAFTVSVVILLTACAMVGLSMLSAVNERTKEIGIMRSLGYSTGAVFAIFCMEALVIGLAAGIVGSGAGYLAATPLIEALGIADMAQISFDPLRTLGICGLMAGLAVVSACMPAWKASRIQPSQALLAL